MHLVILVKALCFLEIQGINGRMTVNAGSTWYGTTEIAYTVAIRIRTALFRRIEISIIITDGAVIPSIRARVIGIPPMVAVEVVFENGISMAMGQLYAESKVSTSSVSCDCVIVPIGYQYAIGVVADIISFNNAVIRYDLDSRFFRSIIWP
jgi:hypothetical protein